MADYSSPRPSDPVSYRRSCYLHIDCRCGRRSTYKLGDFARHHGLPGELSLYRLIARLKCQMCGQRPLHTDVTRYRHSQSYLPPF